MTTFTVQIEVSNAAGDVWQAVAPAENIDTSGWGSGWTAEQVAKATEGNQNVAEKPYRIKVWDGLDADTCTEASFALEVDIEPQDILDDVAAASIRAEQAIGERDNLIREAMARTDVPRVALAKAANVTEARLYQIRDGR